MKNIYKLSAFALGFYLSLFATPVKAEVPPEYFEIASYSISPIESDLDSKHQPLDSNLLTPSINPLDELTIQWDKIVNLGLKIWELVVEGKPVVNVQSHSANALPEGLDTFKHLSGWQAPQSQFYSVEYKNLMGMTVVKFDFRLSFIAGGGYQGKGKYITNASFVPATVDVLWGFKFNANAEVPAVVNMGTAEDPVAGLQMQVNWKIQTAVKELRKTEAFFIGGNNTFKKL